QVIEAHAPWRGILDTAKAVGADLIVMGSHGRRGLEKVVLGSVAQRVLSHAQLSVFIVRD
ncbi:MAG: universal stress protein, partial [Hylemonella sp.]